MLLLLFTHILIALGGLAVAVIGLIKLSDTIIKLSYALTAATIATGTVLVILEPSSLIKSCLMGLLYLAAILVMTAVAKHRLALEKSK